MWTKLHNKLSKKFDFPDFKSALDFVNKVGRIAEDIEHHPDIELSYGKVAITTTTHDEGNKITDKDRKLQKMIDEIKV